MIEHETDEKTDVLGKTEKTPCFHFSMVFVLWVFGFVFFPPKH